MTQIVYDRTFYHDPSTYIAQALDPCNTFEEAVRRGDVTRENAGRVAREYLAWVLQQDPAIDLPKEESYKDAILTDEHLEHYLLEIVGRVERG